MEIENRLQECIKLIDEVSVYNSDAINQEMEEIRSKYEKMIDSYEERLESSLKLTKQIETEETRTEEIRTINENLNVEAIRLETQQKKLCKSLEKLKALNASRIKLDIGDNDKNKMCKSQLKLMLVKLLTGTYLNQEMKGFTINFSENTLMPFQINSNISKESMRETLWENIEKNCPNRDKWENLFDLSSSK